MDKLEKIFELQQIFDNDIIKKRNLTNFTMEEWLQKETLAMLSEMGELLDEVNFKWWKNAKPINLENVKGELVDILHFFIAMCLKTGMDANELFGKYIEKNKENYDRQNGLSSKEGYNQNDGKCKK